MYKISKIDYVKFLFLPVSIFVLISIFFYCLKNGNLYLSNADFSFYHAFAHNFLGDKTSILSNEIYAESIAKCELIKDANAGSCDISRVLSNKIWIPNTFYSVIFLSPITIIGSKFLFFLLGLFMGITIIISSFKAINKLQLRYIDPRSTAIILSIATLYPPFINDTITVSTMGTCIFLTSLGIVSDKKYIRAICLILASFIRPTFIFGLIAVYISIFLIKPKGYKDLALQLLPSLISYFIYYKFIYSSYPGSKFNYLLLAQDHHISFIAAALDKYLLSNYDIDQIYTYKGNIFNILKIIFSDFQIFSYFINLWIAKINLNLGALYESSVLSISGAWVTKPIWHVYHFFIYLPAFFTSFLVIISRVFNRTERSLYLSGMLYIIFHSLLLGSPRYSVGIHIIFVLCLVRFIKVNLKFSDKIS